MLSKKLLTLVDDVTQILVARGLLLVLKAHECLV